jgi:MPBQ/MSBQ methyltransferase
MRLIQHKREAFWFYRFLSLVYDGVNTLFWTPEMRARALELAALDHRDLDILDVGAGTGFMTEGLMEHVTPERVTMLDQSPHQLKRAEQKPKLAQVEKLRGDAERLPFATDSFDRYVSAGSIEYWPDPQAALAEAYRVLREGGRALVIGPLPPANPLARRLAQLWMLFPAEGDYRRWLEEAGFTDQTFTHLAPGWYRARAPYGIAISGRKAASGPSPGEAVRGLERLDEPLGAHGSVRFALRFLVGSAAGLIFVPIAGVLAIRAKLRRRLAQLAE